jgi:hypothetical protein
MLLVSSALLGALLALTSIENARGHTAGNHQVGDASAEKVEESRGLFEDGGTTAAEFDVLSICKTPDPTASEVAAFANMVDQFYQGSQGGNHDLVTQRIEVDINFVNVKHSDGRGATTGQVNAQIDLLNNAFDPDFSFKLKTLQTVTNNKFFSQVNIDDPNRVVEGEMKKQLRKGGMETLNIYFVEPQSNSGTVGGWAYFPSYIASSKEFDFDGVVLLHKSAPGGGHPYWTQGDVSMGCKPRCRAAHIPLFNSNKLCRPLLPFAPGSCP